MLLIGFKMAGKTTAGRNLAKKQSRPFFDCDDELIKLFLEKNRGKRLFSCYAILKEVGEKAFSHLEEKALLSLAKKKKAVIATGGAMGADIKFFSLLQSMGEVIYLHTPLLLLQERILASREKNFFQDSKNSHSLIEKFWKKREKIYQQIAKKTIFTEGKTIDQIVQEILPLVEE